LELTVTVHEENGKFWAEVVELPGCLATGETLDELREALEESVSLYLHDSPAAGTLTDKGEVEAPRHMQVNEIKLLA
jgi:predicted RNase H-like HicB family nuclease